jgi:protein-S-isoprenylcysteine O-methyltransferase Ste14
MESIAAGVLALSGLVRMFAAAAGWIVVRTVLEDRMLRRELPGHERYARRVAWRLVPGAW